MIRIVQIFMNPKYRYRSSFVFTIYNDFTYRYYKEEPESMIAFAPVTDWLCAKQQTCCATS